MQYPRVRLSREISRRQPEGPRNLSRSQCRTYAVKRLPDEPQGRPEVSDFRCADTNLATHNWNPTSKETLNFCYRVSDLSTPQRSGLMNANVHPLITSINASGNNARS